MRSTEGQKASSQKSGDMLFKQRRRRRDSAKHMKEIKEFYLAISRPLPNKTWSRLCITDDSKKCLQMTLKSAYRHFRFQYSAMIDFLV